MINSTMSRRAMPVTLTESDNQELKRWVSSHHTPQQVAQRCRIILAAAKGGQDKDIATDMQINYKTVALWRQRYCSEGPDCLWEVAAGRGRKPQFTAKKIEEVVNATLQTKPARATHWSCRTMADKQGVSKSTINRVWQSHGLQPHRTKQFKLSRDPKFLEKLTDVVGLYLNHPEKALVLCVDEKSQIQALDRTQPGLPMKKGRCGTMTHDYKRNGTTTLFAALNVLDGTIIGRCMQRHRHQEFIRFLNAIEADVPVGKLVHVILDNYATHKHPKVMQWLARHPRFTFHFTPTSASWINAVEGFFAKLTKRRLKRGVFHSLVDLQAAIKRFLAEANNNPRPFRWIKDPDKIIAAVRRGPANVRFDPPSFPCALARV